MGGAKTTNRTGRGLAIVPLLALALALPAASPATADTFKPTRFNDPVPNGCKPNDCSLREAITKANKTEGRDKVKLTAGTYEIQIPENISDDNKGGDFDVTDGVLIAGKGPETVVDGQDVSGVFSLLTFPAHTLKNMTVQNGSRTFGAGVATGPSKTVLKGIALRSNTTTGNGGGLYTVSQKLKISDSTFADNHADVGGGGVYIPAGFIGQPLGNVRDSTFSGNSAALGAGLYLDGDNSGGSDFDPSLDVINSTFAGNQATVSGGGLAVILGSVLEAQHATVAFNGADSDDDSGGSGGGIFQSASGSLQMNDSIVQGNTVGSTGDGPTCAGTFLLVNVVVTPQGGSSCSFLGGSITIGENPPKLGALTDNGGPTETIEVLSGSAALGFAADCPKRDQRGVRRPADDCDAGAYERDGP